MSLVIPPGTGQASVEMRNDGDPQPWYVTFGVDLTDAGGNYQQAALSLTSAFAATIGLQLHTTTTVSGCNLLVGQDGPDRLVIRYNTSVAGQTSSQMLPQNCAALYDKTTNRAGRMGKGRFYMPSVLKEAEVSGVGVISEEALDDLQFQADAFLDRLSEPEVSQIATPMVLLHNTGSGSTLPDPVIRLNVQQVISTQRRRLR